MNKIKNCRHLKYDDDGYYCDSTYVCYKPFCNNNELFPIRLAWNNYEKEIQNK